MNHNLKAVMAFQSNPIDFFKCKIFRYTRKLTIGFGWNVVEILRMNMIFTDITEVIATRNSTWYNTVQDITADNSTTVQYFPSTFRLHQDNISGGDVNINMDDDNDALVTALIITVAVLSSVLVTVFVWYRCCRRHWRRRNRVDVESPAHNGSVG